MGEIIYDVVIIGGGPAGLTAALYTSRAKLNTLVIEKSQVGGQAATTEEIENWPGLERTKGAQLAQDMKAHAEKFGAQFYNDEVTALVMEENRKVVKGKIQDYKTKAVIIATGAEPRVLGIPGERELRGKGVSYCATCDADFFTELDVVVLGNGDAAIEEAMYLTRFAETVTIIVIHDEGKVDATPIVAERAFRNEKIKWVWNSTIQEICGDGIVEKVLVKNIKTGKTDELFVNGVFVFVGTVPLTKFLAGTIDLDERGFIEADHINMSTNIDGVFAAGDCRQKELYQVVTAAGDGATAAIGAQKYISEEENFHNEVLAQEKPVAVLFWSPASEDSMAKVPLVEKAVEEADQKVKLVKIDTYRNQRIARRYNIDTIPALVIFKAGKEQCRIVGTELTGESLRERISNLA